MKLLHYGLGVAIAVLGVLLFTVDGNSQTFRSVAVNQHANYNASYYHNNNYVQTNDVIIGIPVAPDYYYSVGEGETPEERNQRIADAVIKKFEEKFQLSGDNAKSEQQPEQVTGDLFRLVGGDKARQTADGINQNVFALLNTSCIKCHKPGASKPGRIQLFTADRKLFSESEPQKEYARRLRVYESVESGEMPKNGPVLPGSAKALLKEWLSLAQAKK